MIYSEKRECKNCEFGNEEICILSGDRANKRNCIPSDRYPNALKEWIERNPECKQ